MHQRASDSSLFNHHDGGWRVVLLLLPSLLLASSPLSATQAPCKADQASALRDINPTIGNDPCIVHTHDTNVTCDSDGNVVGLRHSTYQPRHLQDSITTLSKLTSLVLGGSFSGSLPVGISALTSMQYMALGFNHFSGSIPDGISALTNLRVIDLYGNAFHGSLPAGLFALTNLQWIFLHHNLLSGSLPSGMSLLKNLRQITVGANRFSGSLPAGISALTNLRKLELGENRFIGSLTNEISELTNLQYMLLSRNNFNGSLPRGLSALTGLQYLDLSYNQLTGSIPHEISALWRLRTLSVNSNQLSGYIPAELGSFPFLHRLEASGLSCPISNSSCIVKQTPNSTFCQACSHFCLNCNSTQGPPLPPLTQPSSSTTISTPPLGNSSSSSSSTPIGLIAGVSVAAVLLLAAAVALAACLIVKRNKGSDDGHPLIPSFLSVKSLPLEHKPFPTAPSASKPFRRMDPLQQSCKVYSFSQLQQATGGCLESNVLGSGAFGTVYKGRDPVNPHVPVAIKRARVYTNKFKDEVRVVAGLHHPHVVRLLGYCDEIRHKEHQVEQILVFEFVPNGDLHNFLRTEKLQGLAVRLNILIGVASGLQYLHSLGIVHRDIKPHNVLLGLHWEAKLADFGLVREMEGTSIHTTAIVGTPGYVDPAYIMSRYATPSVDVYSFGVLMLQIITCHECMADEEVHVHAWAEPLFQAGDASALKHPAVEAPDEVFLRLVGLALSCTTMPPSKRPGMLDILAVLRSVSQELYPTEFTPFANKVDEQLQSLAVDFPNSLEEDWESLGQTSKTTSSEVSQKNSCSSSFDIIHFHT